MFLLKMLQLLFLNNFLKALGDSYGVPIQWSSGQAVLKALTINDLAFLLIFLAVDLEH